MSSESKTLAGLLLNNAEKNPDCVAIVYKGRSHTYGDHYQRALKLANALSRAGCRPGDRAAILAKNCIQYLELYSACELAGYIIVPINFRLSVSEACHVCENTTPLVLFYTPEYDTSVESIRKHGPGIQHYVRIDDENDSGDQYSELVDSGEPKLPSYLPSVEDAACIIHTSGTTGRAKGAVLGQGALHGIAETIGSDAEITADDYGLVMQPLFHVGAKFLQLAHHVRGAKIYLDRGFDPATVWQTLVDENITTMQLVPTMLDMLLDEISDRNYPDTKLKTIFYSTAPIRESLLRRGLDVFGQVFLQQYGSTEGGQITSLAKHHHIKDGSEKEQRWLMSAGTANPGVEVRIIDSNGEVLPAGESGEIIVRHGNIMRGYWNDTESTSGTIIDGFLHMGDIGYLDSDGFLYIVDRKKDMIISGGENIYPREVEAALVKHPAVDEAAVIGIPDERWGEAVHAIVVCKAGSEVGEKDLIAHCREYIASYKKPRAITFVDELPRIATGKVDKVSLRKPYWQGQNRSVI